MSLTVVESRLQNVLETWRSLSGTALVVLAGSQNDEVRNQRAVALLQYIFNASKPPENVGLLLTSDSCTIIESGTTPRFHGAQLKICLKGAELKEILPTSFYAVERELALQKGPWAEEMAATLKSMSPVEANSHVALLLSQKDDVANKCVRKAVALSQKVLKVVALEQVEQNLKEEQPASMTTIAEKVSKCLHKVTEVPGLETIAEADDYTESFSPVLIQSGGEHQIDKITGGAPTLDKPLSKDCINIAFGCSNRGFAAYLARTLIVHPTCSQTVRDAYKFVLKVSNKVIDLLVPGTPMNKVYHEALQYAKSLNEDLASKLVPQFGFGLGLLIMDAKHNINEKNPLSVAAGMTLAVRVVLTNVDNNGQSCTIQLGDTVGVSKKGADLYTKAKREPNEILYKVETEESEAEDEDAIPSEEVRDLTKITRAGNRGAEMVNREELRAAQLSELMQRNHKAWLDAGGKNEIGAALEEYKNSELGLLGKNESSAYPTEKDFPTAGLKAAEPYLDLSRETLWLPISGADQPSTPFHVATINKVEQSTRGNNTHVLTVTFHSTQESNLAFRSNRTKVFIKEASFTHSDGGKLFNIVQGVRTITQNIKSRDQSRKQSSGVVQQGGLKTKSGAPRLPDVKCRPPPVTGRSGCTGNLEAHENGLRYSSNQFSPALDILYSNVKHLIFQPSKNDICVILHLALKQPILLNKKKTDHIQFVAEVMETSEQMTLSRRTHDEELAAEDKERERIKLTNQQFALFANKAGEISGLQPELALKDMDIQGVTARSITRVRGNERCVWAINELPFFALNLSEVEVASVERVIPNGANFDLFFVKKDYRTVVSITTIPMAKVEVIKDWLLQSKVVYFESTSNIQWSEMLKVIRADDEWEPWGESGWKEMIDPEEDSDEEDSDDDESDFEPDSDEEDETDDSDDSEWAEEVSEDSSVETEASDESASEDDDSDHWDRMERKLQDEDKRRRRDSDEDSDDSDEPRRKRAKTEKRLPAKGAAKKSVSAPNRGGIGTAKAKGGIAPARR